MFREDLSPLRVAVVGTGAIATRAHLPTLQQHPDVQTVALVDVNTQRAATIAAQFGVSTYYTDYAIMLAEAAPELVIISTPNVYHAPMTIAALEAGSHVLCEKPMALRVEDAQRMIEASQRAGRVLAIAHHMRYRPEVEVLKRLISEGQLGNIYYVKVSMLRRRGIPGFGSWFTNRELAGGGALMDIGVHMVDLAMWFLGYPTPTTVMGVTYNEFGHRGRGVGTWGVDAPPEGAVLAPDARCDVEDLASGFVRFSNGATMTVDATWAGFTTGEERIQVLGTEGGAEIHVPDLGGSPRTPLKVFSEMAGRPTESLPLMPVLPPEQTDRWRQLTNLIHAIRTGGPPRCTGPQGMMVTGILTALQESAQRGQSVEVRLPQPV